MRTTQQFLLTTNKFVGGTANFAAPELRETGSTAASDMFALGRTVDILRDACIDEDSTSSAADVNEFVKVLTHDAYLERPSADEAAKLAFFQPLLQHRLVATSTCCIGAFCSGQPLRESQGVVCGAGHFTCKDCLKGHVQSLSEQELRLLRERDGMCMCPKRNEGCAAAPFSDSQLSRVVPATVFESYMAGRMKVLESNLREEIEEPNERRIQAELEKLRSMDEKARNVLAARKHVEDNLLTSKCPRCKTAFLDFEGCCALKCSKCPCAFCAWCAAESLCRRTVWLNLGQAAEVRAPTQQQLTPEPSPTRCGQDCGTDAHGHVARCPKKPDGADVFYPGTRFNAEQVRSNDHPPLLQHSDADPQQRQHQRF
jgi:hypothetical protein